MIADPIFRLCLYVAAAGLMLFATTFLIVERQWSAPVAKHARSVLVMSLVVSILAIIVGLIAASANA